MSVVAAPAGLRDDRETDLLAEFPQLVAVGTGLPLRRGRIQRIGETLPHQELVLGMLQRVGPRSHELPVGHQAAQDAGGHVFVVERDDVATGREGAHGRLVGVVADRHVLENPRCAHVRPLGQQPQPDAQPGGWGIHHAGQLAAADNSDGGATHPHRLSPVG
ncbi:hypothetical protein SDC9_140175 [bioreactor metagenome]|uniref:Uncharacterized protein n=1 Tax=bioreactor metagenome TaxID=1076179 RepID=A0A645DUR6_9ZZZZ